MGRGAFNRAFLAASVLLVVVLVAGCRGGLSPEEAVAKAYAATAEASSYRVESTVKVTSEGETTEGTWEMEVVAPDRIHLKTSGGGGWSEVIIIGDAQYARDSDYPDWRSGSDLSKGFTVVAPILSQEQTLGHLQSLVDLEELPEEKVNGVNCLHYKGKVDAAAQVEKQKAKLDPSQPGYEETLQILELQARSEITVELWIGKDDYLIRQEKIDARWLVMSSDISEVPQEVWAASSILQRFFDFNEPIQIEAPR